MITLRTLGIISLSLAAAVFFSPAAAWAASPLYAAANPVPDQSARARRAALHKDLATVFVKVSGDPSASRLASRAGARRMLLQYRYQKAAPTAGGGLALWARFDKKQVDAALDAVGKPIWSANRPRVVAWVLAPGGIVSDDATNPIATALHQAARQRGLPLVLPLMDIEDRQKVSGFDIKSFALVPLEQESRRYAAQAFLVGTISSPRVSNGSVSSRWQFALGAVTSATPFPVVAPSPRTAASQAVEKAASLLASRFAVVSGTGAGGPIELAIVGVTHLRAEASVRRYLADVGGVKALRLARVAGDALHFVVTYAGSPKELARRLSLSGFLARDDTTAIAPLGASAPPPALTFRYTP